MAQGLAIPVPLNSVCDLMHTTEKNIRLGGPSLHMVFGPGSFLCTNFFVLFLGEQRKSILLPQMKDTHNCNQSNWTTSLNLKKKKQVEPQGRRENKGLTLGFCPQISFYPSLQIWFSVQEGELMIMESWEESGGTPDYYLLHSLNWNWRGMDDPPLPQGWHLPLNFWASHCFIKCTYLLTLGLYKKRGPSLYRDPYQYILLSTDNMELMAKGQKH